MKSSATNPCTRTAVIPFFLTLFAITSCDLFNGPKVDLFQIISDEVDWANAKKVVVTVDFPPEWGASPQRGIGKCGDTRVGYGFDLSFSANPEYGMIGWRVYKTADLPANWLKNPEYYIEEVMREREITGVTMPSASDSGSAGKVTVNVAEDITIVPYSRRQPRVLRISPEPGTSFSTSQEIKITFAAPVQFYDVDRKINEDLSVTGITPDPLGNLSNDPKIWDYLASHDIITVLSYKDGSLYDVSATGPYDPPTYDPVTCTITIKPDTYLMNSDTFGLARFGPVPLEIVLGTGITVGGSSSQKEPQTFSWNLVEYMSLSPQASYSDGQIKLEWSVSGATSQDLHYRINGGPKVTLSNYPLPVKEDDGWGGYYTVPSQWTYDVSAYADGANAVGIEFWFTLRNDDFNIIIETDEDKPVWAWNIPNFSSYCSGSYTGVGNGVMYSSINGNPVSVITNLKELKEMDPTKGGILARDIAITGTWIPVGTAGKPFIGVFYGMGKTIRFANSGFMGIKTDTANGIFGVVNAASNAVIEYLTVAYDSNLKLNLNSTAASFGLIAGSMTNNTATTSTIRNCTVRSGNMQIAIPSSLSAFSAGGLVGSLSGSGNITVTNCAANLAMTVSGYLGNANVGGLVGQTNTGKTISNCRADVSLVADSASDAGTLYTGGLVGQAGDSITKCCVTGTVKGMHDAMGSGLVSSAPVYTGGLVGGSAGSVANSWASAVVYSRQGWYNYEKHYAGGLVGFRSGGSITRCYALGSVEAVYGKNLYAGGIVGFGSGGAGTTYCAALNPAVKGNKSNSDSAFIGRVAGSESTLSNNAAFNGMDNTVGEYSGELWSSPWPTVAANNIHGADITKTAIQQGDGTVGSRFTPGNGWTIVPGKLPGFGQAVELPEHLK